MIDSFFLKLIGPKGTKKPSLFKFCLSHVSFQKRQTALLFHRAKQINNPRYYFELRKYFFIFVFKRIV